MGNREGHDFIKSKYEPVDYDYTAVERLNRNGNTSSDQSEDDDDPMLEEAMEEIIRAGKASASLLQRRLKVGYARAARILDLLEQRGFIGPADGAKPREILKADFGRSTPERLLPPAVLPSTGEEDSEPVEL